MGGFFFYVPQHRRSDLIFLKMRLDLDKNLNKEDGMEKPKITTITFYPKAIIEYVEKKGFITTRDLEKDFGYTNNLAQIEILSYLKHLSILASKDDDFEIIKEENKAIRRYRLTEQGRRVKRHDGPVVFRIEALPVFSKLTLELFNEMADVAQARGMELEELIETAELNPTEFREIVDKSRVAILGEYSPEELKELAKELKNFLPRDSKAVMEE